MVQELVSVIVPVYNLKEYLDKCVSSICAQTYQNLEIILVDDGSTDGSGVLCDKYASQDSRIQVVHKENGGLVSAWKRGFAESKGTYISFVDGDDWIDAQMIEELAARGNGVKGEIISCDYLIERPDSEQAVYQTLEAGVYDREQIKNQVIPNLLGNEERIVCFSRCMKLISRELLEHNAHYSEGCLRMGEDLAVILPSLIDCQRLVILDKKAYYHYLYNTESMVHKYDKNLHDNVLQLRVIMNRIIADKEMPYLQGAVNKEFIWLYMLIIKNEARGNPTGYKENIRKYCMDSEMRCLLKQNPIKVSNRANKLLYLVMKHPNDLYMILLRLAMLVYYR